MRIRMKVDVSGTRNGRAWPARGGVVEVSDAEGADLCSAGMADPVAERPAETATVPSGDIEKRTPAPKATSKAQPKSGGRPTRGRR